MAKLIGCMNAKHVSLSGVHLATSDVGRLRDVRHLESLEVANCDLTDAHFAAHAELEKLPTLSLTCDKVDLHGSLKLTKLLRLRKLELTTNEPAEKYDELQQQLGKRFEISRLTR